MVHFSGVLAHFCAFFFFIARSQRWERTGWGEALAFIMLPSKVIFGNTISLMWMPVLSRDETAYLWHRSGNRQECFRATRIRNYEFIDRESRRAFGDDGWQPICPRVSAPSC
jgi:hypothetical protein